MKLNDLSLLGIVFEHVKTKGKYIVLQLVTDATNGPSDGRTMVLYLNLVTGRLFVRDLNEFLEPGRFVRVGGVSQNP